MLTSYTITDPPMMSVEPTPLQSVRSMAMSAYDSCVRVFIIDKLKQAHLVVQMTRFFLDVCLCVMVMFADAVMVYMIPTT